MKRLAVRIVDAVLRAIDWITSRTWAMAIALVLAFCLPEICYALYLLWRDVR